MASIVAHGRNSGYVDVLPMMGGIDDMLADLIQWADTLAP
jgi:hypothetical protein